MVQETKILQVPKKYTLSTLAEIQNVLQNVLSPQKVQIKYCDHGARNKKIFKSQKSIL